jgi:hypothetical protein
MKIFKIENIIKGIALTTFGLIIIGFSFYWWAIDEMTDMQALGAGAVGFALMYMRSRLDDFITRLFDNFIGKKK